MSGRRQAPRVDSQRQSLPTHADVNLTNACNLACAHCHASSGHKLPWELDTGEFQHIISELYKAGILSVVMAGGEPFARRDAIEIVSHACALSGWQTAVVTNGMHLARDATKIAGRCRGLDVNVSIDGSTAERFAILRGQRGHAMDPGWAFRGACDGVRASVDAGLRTSVNFTMTKPTIQDTKATYDLAVDALGAESVVAIKFFPAGYGKENLARLELPFDLWSREFVRLTKSKLAGELSRLQVSVPAAWEFYLPLAEAGIDVAEAEAAWGYRAPLREPRYAASATSGDVAGRREIAVAPNGDVYPSVLAIGEPEAVCGNLRRSTLRQILCDADLLGSLRALELESIAGGCVECGFARICGGGSRVRAWSRARSWVAADASCPLTSTEPSATAAASMPDPLRLTYPRLLTGSSADGADDVRLLEYQDRMEARYRGKIVHWDKFVHGPTDRQFARRGEHTDAQ